MFVRNVRGRALEIVATGQLVNPDETAEVPDDLGASLCRQPANWTQVRKKKTESEPEEGDEA